MESLLQGYVGYSSMVMAKKLRELGGGSVRVPVSHGTIWRFRALQGARGGAEMEEMSDSFVLGGLFR